MLQQEARNRSPFLLPATVTRRTPQDAQAFCAAVSLVLSRRQQQHQQERNSEIRNQGGRHEKKVLRVCCDRLEVPKMNKQLRNGASRSRTTATAVSAVTCRNQVYRDTFNGNVARSVAPRCRERIVHAQLSGRASQRSVEREMLSINITCPSKAIVRTTSRKTKTKHLTQTPLQKHFYCGLDGKRFHFCRTAQCKVLGSSRIGQKEFMLCYRADYSWHY